MGVNNHRPSIRAGIMIARILAHRGGHAAWSDTIFRRICQDVLNTNTIKISRDGKALMQEKISDIIQKVCKARHGKNTEELTFIPETYCGSAAGGVKERKTMKTPMKRKGMNDIKTHAGTVDQTFLPHKAFMRISCLEMEKAHRIKEMESSRRRIETVKKRLKEIETETDALMNRIKADTKESSIVSKKTTDNSKGLVLRY